MIFHVIRVELQSGGVTYMIVDELTGHHQMRSLAELGATVKWKGSFAKFEDAENLLLTFMVPEDTPWLPIGGHL